MHERENPQRAVNVTEDGLCSSLCHRSNGVLTATNVGFRSEAVDLGAL